MPPHTLICRQPVSRFCSYLATVTKLCGLSLALGVMAGACAKVVAPPGGPEDKTPPVVLTAEPHSNQTRVPRGKTFTVTFSENIDPRSVTKQFFVTPRQSQPPKINVHGPKLTATFADSFSVNQTYVITIGSGVRDMRGNQLGSSEIFAFTRGEKIDTGHIAGVVTDSDSPASGVGVALYRNFTPQIIGDLDSLYPDYFTVSGSDGAFELAFLPVDDYFILAFRDKDKNQLFQYGVEDFGVTTRALHVGSVPADNLELRMQSRDTTQPAILSTTFNSDGLLRVNLTRKLRPDVFADKLENISLLNPVDSSLVSHPLALKNPHGAPTKRFEFYFPGLESGDYLLKIDFTNMYTDGRSSAAQFTAITRDVTIDTHEPSVESREALDFIAPWESLLWSYTFSEPVVVDSSNTNAPSDSLSAAITLTDTRKRLLKRDVRSDSPCNLRITTSLLPVRGEIYTLTLNPQSIKDIAGNTLDDSTLTDSVIVWPTDSLGTLKLSVDNKFDSLYDGQYFLKLSRLHDRDFWAMMNNPDSIRLSLPAGDYIVEALLDTSQNAVGSLYPLRYAAPRAFYPDTVNVRPRFDTEGIRIVIE